VDVPDCIKSKKERRKWDFLFHPDKNIDCVLSAAEKFKKFTNNVAKQTIDKEGNYNYNECMSWVAAAAGNAAASQVNTRNYTSNQENNVFKKEKEYADRTEKAKADAEKAAKDAAQAQAAADAAQADTAQAAKAEKAAKAAEDAAEAQAAAAEALKWEKQKEEIYTTLIKFYLAFGYDDRRPDLLNANNQINQVYARAIGHLNEFNQQLFNQVKKTKLNFYDDDKISLIAQLKDNKGRDDYNRYIASNNQIIYASMKQIQMLIFELKKKSVNKLVRT
jgi:hypothetical protein